MKYSLLILKLVVLSPICLAVVILIGATRGVLELIEDVLSVLQQPEKSKLYRWMGWE
jgi:hypothetical protein